MTDTLRTDTSSRRGSRGVRRRRRAPCWGRNSQISSTSARKIAGPLFASEECARNLDYELVGDVAVSIRHFSNHNTDSLVVTIVAKFETVDEAKTTYTDVYDEHRETYSLEELDFAPDAHVYVTGARSSSFVTRA